MRAQRLFNCMCEFRAPLVFSLEPWKVVEQRDKMLKLSLNSDISIEVSITRLTFALGLTELKTGFLSDYKSQSPIS